MYYFTFNYVYNFKAFVYLMGFSNLCKIAQLKGVINA